MDDLLIRCSALHKVMGERKDAAGLTENQEAELKELIEKEKAPNITEKQAEEIEKLMIKDQEGKITQNQLNKLYRLIEKRDGPNLTQKQYEKKAELLEKKDYRPEFDITEGAKTYIKSLVKQYIYEYTNNADSKQTLKGTLVEDDSIELLNRVLFKKYIKNEESKKNEFIKGTCDIYSEKEDLIWDIKSSFTKETFPAIAEDINAPEYEWQGRGYMMLYDCDHFRLAYCLISTPPQLIPYGANVSLHYCEDIEDVFRVTCSQIFFRDKKLEERIIYKVKECRKYAQWYFDKITDKY